MTFLGCQRPTEESYHRDFLNKFGALDLSTAGPLPPTVAAGIQPKSAQLHLYSFKQLLSSFCHAYIYSYC